MNKEQLIQELIRCQRVGEADAEKAHSDADDALIEFINDSEVKEAFELINKWYA